jgi:hypothetical protein
VFQEKCNEDRNTHLMFNNFAPENCAVCEIKRENNLEPDRLQLII